MKSLEQQPSEEKQERENRKRRAGDGVHTGKISRLPHHIREQLNQRLRDGKQTRAVLDWLNGLPETKQMLAQKAEPPVNKQNLSDWRRGGYAEWLRRQEALAETRRMMEDAQEFARLSGRPLADEAAALLSVQCALLLGRLQREGAADLDAELRQVHRLCQDISVLRRGNQGADWVSLENRRVTLLEDRQEGKQVEQFLKWYENPTVKATLEETNMSYREKLDMLGQEMFGDYWNPEWRPRKEFPPGLTNDPPLMVRMREEEERKKKAEAEKAKAAAVAEHGVHPLGCSKPVGQASSSAGFQA